jgi:hypothetical protein
MIKQTVIWTADDRDTEGVKMVTKIVSWVVEGKKLHTSEWKYPICQFVEEDCEDMIIIAGHCVCDVYYGHFKRCPYLREE